MSRSASSTAVALALVLAQVSGARAQPSPGPIAVPGAFAVPTPPPPPLEPGWHRQEVVLFVPAPRQPRTVRRPLTGLWVAGLVVLAAAYVSDVGLTALFDTPQVGTAAIPLAGPWLQFGREYEKNGAAARTLLAVDGVLQASGAAMLVLGLSIWRQETRYTGRPRWLAGPLVAPGVTGGQLSVDW